MRRLLAVLPDHPVPLDMGSRVRNVRILEALSSRFELCIVSLVHRREHLAAPGPVATLGKWVPVLAPHRRSRARHLAAHLRSRLAGRTEGLHRETFFMSFPELSREVERQLDAFRPDLVHVAYWYALRHLDSFPRPPLWIVDTHDVQFERHERLWQRVSPREKAAELRELARFDHVLAITGHDRDVFVRELGPDLRCEVMPMGVDTESWAPESVAPDKGPAPRVVFYGNMTNQSNQLAARHLLDDLVPPLRSEVPDIEVTLLGSGTPDDLRAAAEANPTPVHVTGFVEDVRPHLLSGRVLALSLRSGSGQRGRVVEALALGVPVVGYRGGLEGLEFADGEGVVIVDDETQFVEALRRLLLDPAEARTLGLAGRAAVVERYGTAATYGRFPLLYETWLDAAGGPRS
ncbi:MAG: glycosyltransferase family 4 protein [Candidatus Eisenbacteria bacterium]